MAVYVPIPLNGSHSNEQANGKTIMIPMDQ